MCKKPLLVKGGHLTVPFFANAIVLALASLQIERFSDFALLTNAGLRNLKPWREHVSIYLKP